MSQVGTVLAALRDVAGVQGSFVLTADGALAGRDLPALFEDAVLAEAASRIARLAEAFASVGDDVDVCLVRFADHKLYVRAFGAGRLCVLAAADVNLPALRMATNLVTRRLGPALAAEAAAPAPPAAPPPPTPPAPAAGPMRMYRGRPVG